MGRHSKKTLIFIEHIAQEQFRYETIYNKQNEILQGDPPWFEAAVARIQRSPLVSQHGQSWLPVQNKVDEYLAQCDELCRITPQNFDDRVKILYAAHAAMMCLILCTEARQPESVQMAIMRRHCELGLSPRPMPPASNHDELAPPKPSTDPRCITAAELELFRNPENLHGKRFILSPKTEDSEMYEVVRYWRNRDKSVEFEVLFEGCGDDGLIVNHEEMMVMLVDSLYFPA